MKNNYLIIGDDEYIRDNEISKIRNKFLTSSEIDLNYSVYNPEEIESVVDSLGTMPFLSDNRVVIVKDKENKGFSADFIEAVLSYLEKYVPTSILVLSCGSSFKKNKNYKTISKLVEIIKADKPEATDIKKWINTFFKKNQTEISPGAVNLIVQLKGDDTIGVKSELYKLLSFSGGKRIEEETIEALVGRSVTESVFKLVDAINENNSKWVFRILNDLYDQKKQPPEIIGYLGWYIRIIQKIIYLQGKGMSKEALAGELGYSPAYVGRLSLAARKYPIKRVDRWVSAILKADRDIKTGRMEAKLAVETLLVNLIK